MKWELIFGGIAAASALLGANAWLMKIVIESAVTKAMLSIEKDFVDKDTFNRHVDDANAHK